MWVCFHGERLGEWQGWWTSLWDPAAEIIPPSTTMHAYMEDMSGVLNP